jgi:hypothetical protein
MVDVRWSDRMLVTFAEDVQERGIAFHSAPCHSRDTSILEPRRIRKRRTLLFPSRQERS